MSERRLKRGDRVRLKVRSIFGWKGCGTYLGGGAFVRDGSDGLTYGPSMAADYELARMRDQTPNPEHAQIVASWEWCDV